MENQACSVLVVDDNEGIRFAVAQVLRGAGYEVHTAADGLEGVDLALLHCPDLILMDLDMPRLTGWDALARLKADVWTAKIPVVAISAALVDLKRVREAGFDCLLFKPWTARQLLDGIAGFVPVVYRKAG